MARYTIEFGALGDARPVPDLTVQTTDLNVLDKAVVVHARPHITPVLTELGRPELADCLFRMNKDRTMGQFLHLNMATGMAAEFLPARITTTPERIQRKRTKGWRAPAGAAYVGRGTPFGNPWVIVQTQTGTGWAVNWAGHANQRKPLGLNDHIPASSQRDAHALAVELYEVWVHRHPTLLDRITRDLAGRDLMCWCTESLPCHADTLIDLATAPKEN